MQQNIALLVTGINKAIHNKTKKEFINDLYELHQVHNSLKANIETDFLSQKLTKEALRASEGRFHHIIQ